MESFLVSQMEDKDVAVVRVTGEGSERFAEAVWQSGYTVLSVLRNADKERVQPIWSDQLHPKAA